MFKRLMVLGAVGSALVFSACQDKNRDANYQRTPADQVQPATGGSGMQRDEAIPGSSGTMGGVRQEVRPGTELQGSGSSSDSIQGNQGAGGSGTLNDQNQSGTLDKNGTGGSGSLDDVDKANSSHQDNGLVHDQPVQPSQPEK